MAWTAYQIILALTMVTTGSINTIATKWADTTESVGIDGYSHLFDHPFLQAVGMFLGEMSCLLAFKLMILYYKQRSKRNLLESSDSGSELPAGINGNQNFSPFIFLPPAMCDLVGTSIMYVGLNLTYASSFQMLRGSVIVFTALLSVAFLGRTVKRFEWVGIFFIICGLLTVGISDILFSPTDALHGQNSIITGDLLIVLGQIITASQMVLEEKFVTKHNVPPLQAVGWEGTFGFVVLSILVIPMSFIAVGQQLFHNPNNNMEDPLDAFTQMKNSWQVSLGFAGTIVSIAFFNFAGVSVTKELSATTRMVLDSVRTLVIWLFSLAVSWQTFSYIQLIGFFVLVLGMCLYNDILIRPFMIKKGWLAGEAEDGVPILQDGPVAEGGSINTEIIVDHTDTR